jgi:pyruvate dehydrogenase E2 component (dihydrolipoamide acetyltransferase)
MESGSISAWNVKAGDSVVAGDVFASIETDKAVVDFEAQDDGIIAQILVPAGAEVKVNSPVMILVSDPEHVSAFANYTLDTASATTTTAPTSPATASPTLPAVVETVSTPTASPVKNISTNGKVFASPLARKLAQEMGYDISVIRGSGPSGRIIAADVKEYQPAAATVAATTTAVTETSSPTVASSSSTTKSSKTITSSPVVGSGYTDYPIPISAMDVAARLAQSKRNVPHYYLTVDINADALLQLRRTLNAHITAGTNKDSSAATTIGVYELLIKAAGLAMRTIPSANAAWMDTHVRVYDSVDVNIVMGAGESLKIRTIRNVAGVGVKAISTELTRSDDTDNTKADNGLGTFTMLNVGMYGVKSCAPIIREPQACAIAIGALQNRIVPSTGGSKSEEESTPYQESVMFTVTASFDHRVVDGAVGAQWLSAFKSHVENPSTLLL